MKRYVYPLWQHGCFCSQHVNWSTHIRLWFIVRFDFFAWSCNDVATVSHVSSYIIENFCQLWYFNNDIIDFVTCVSGGSVRANVGTNDALWSEHFWKQFKIHWLNIIFVFLTVYKLDLSISFGLLNNNITISKGKIKILQLCYLVDNLVN